MSESSQQRRAVVEAEDGWEVKKEVGARILTEKMIDSVGRR